MHRAILPAALAAICAAAIVAVAVTGEGGGASSISAQPSGTPLLSPRRVPLLVAGPEAERRLVAALDSIGRRAPRSSCLIVSDGRRVLFEREPVSALLPASATKLLTAAAVLTITDGGGEAPEQVVRMLRESDNDAAVELLDRIGGGDRAREALAEAGVPTDGVQLVDGSGLDRANRATCRALHAVLVRAPAGGPIDSGLAVAGRSGTLADRYRGTDVEGRLRAKTGSIRGVAALAGHAESRTGARLTFVQLLNGVTSRQAAELQDALAATLVAHPDPSLTELLGPSAP